MGAAALCLFLMKFYRVPVLTVDNYGVLKKYEDLRQSLPDQVCPVCRLFYFTGFAVLKFGP